MLEGVMAPPPVDTSSTADFDPLWSCAGETSQTRFSSKNVDILTGAGKQ